MKKILIANWKMRMLAKPALEYAKKIRNKEFKNLELAIGPSSVHLEAVGKVLVKSKVNLVAQNVAGQDLGSFTGEVSARMLKQAGCKYVIVGHSERRQGLSETDEMVNNKVKQALKYHLTPILCVGETEKENKAGKRDTVLVQQIKNDLSEISDLCQKQLVIAYEPVWAIGTGRIVDTQDLEGAFRVIKRAVSMICSSNYFDEKVRFIYGGSIDSTNAGRFWELPYVQGFLVGGASLSLKEFLKIAKQAQFNRA